MNVDKDSADKMLTISGSPEAVALAQREVAAILKDFIEERYPLPFAQRPAFIGKGGSKIKALEVKFLVILYCII